MSAAPTPGRSRASGRPEGLEEGGGGARELWPTRRTRGTSQQLPFHIVSLPEGPCAFRWRLAISLGQDRYVYGPGKSSQRLHIGAVSDAPSGFSFATSLQGEGPVLAASFAALLYSPHLEVNLDSRGFPTRPIYQTAGRPAFAGKCFQDAGKLP